MKKLFYLLVCSSLVISCEFFGMVEYEPRECYIVIENESDIDIVADILWNESTLRDDSLYIKSGRKEKYFLGGGEDFEENFRVNAKGDTLHVLIYPESVNLSDWLLHKNDSLLLVHYRLTLDDIGRKNYTYTIHFSE